MNNNYGNNQYGYGIPNYYQNNYYQNGGKQGYRKKNDEYSEYMVNHSEDQQQPKEQKMEDLFVIKEKKAKKKDKSQLNDKGDN